VSEALRAALLAAADAVDAARAKLGVLDGAAGDGDHGMSMSIGARNLRRRLEALPPDASAPEIVRAAASAMIAVGGAIGPLYDAALGAAARILEEQVDEPALARLRGAAVAAERAIVELGGASPGDKTLVDALHPLVESLRASEQDGHDLAGAITSAIEAAASGAAGTAEMVARVGRASRLGERSRGLPDAGATSLAIVIRAMADAWRTPTTGPNHG
jgi:dihydroxyacetone kinase